jgi:hypothetical protein
LHLQSTDDFNDPSPAAGAVQGRRPFQPWGAITFQSQDLGTTYQALQAKVERRVTDGITGLISYTWSKFMQSNQSPALGGNIGYERTYSPFNTPQNLAMSGSYQLPVGRGRKYMANSSHFVDAVLGGWQVQTIIVLRSGTPYTPIVSTDRANTGVPNQRPNINPAGGSPTFHKSLSSWFDKTAYVVAPQFTYGQVKAFTLQSDTFDSTMLRFSRTSLYLESPCCLSESNFSTCQIRPALTHPAQPLTRPPAAPSLRRLFRLVTFSWH